jgi:hypothetical protein
VFRFGGVAYNAARDAVNPLIVLLNNDFDGSAVFVARPLH